MVDKSKILSVLGVLFILGGNSSAVTLFGRVLDRQTSVALASVKVVTLPPTQEVCTNSQGRYSISNAKAHHHYVVYVGKNHYTINHADIRTQNASSRLQVDMVMEPEGRLSSFSTCSPNLNLASVGSKGIMGAIYATGYAWVRHNAANPAAAWDLDKRDYNAYSIDRWTYPVIGAVVQTSPVSERVVTNEVGHFVIDKVVTGRKYVLKIVKPNFVVTSNSPVITAPSDYLAQADMLMNPRLARPVFTQKNNASSTGYIDLGIENPSQWATYIDSFVDGQLIHANTHIHEAPRFVTRSLVLKMKAIGRRGTFGESPIATVKVNVSPITLAYHPTFRLRSAEIGKLNGNEMSWDQMGMDYQNRPDTYADVATRVKNRWKFIIKTKIIKNTFEPYWSANTTSKASKDSQFRVRIFEASGSQQAVRSLGSKVVTITPSDLKRGYIIVGRFGFVNKLIITLKNSRVLTAPEVKRPSIGIKPMIRKL